LATKTPENTDQAQQAAAQECMPCGGRGTLISKLGGQESTVQCPWCEGSGQRRPGIDAQGHWEGQAQPEAKSAEEPAAGS